MAETFAQRIAKEQAKLKRQASTATAAQRLQHASLDDTDLPVKDREGKVKATWGKQPDGSHGGRVMESPEQPTPLGVEVVVGRAGSVQVTWSGRADGDVPLVHGRVEVLSQHLPDGVTPDPTEARVRSTIRDRDGGSTTISCPVGGTWVVWLRMVGQDSVKRSPFSEPVTFEVETLFDAEDFEERFLERILEFADGQLQDAAYNSLMARLGEFLVVRAGQVEADAFDGMVVTAPTMQSHLEEFLGWKLRPGSGLEMWGTDQKKTVQIDGVQNFIQGSLATAEGVAGRVHLRRYAASEIYSGTPSQQVLAGMGFESGSIPRVAGAFVQENDGRVVLSSGTGGDSTQGRPYGYLAGGWEAQWLRPRDRLETFDSCIVGRPVSPPLINNYRVAPSGEQEPSYTRLGDWVMLSGAIRKPLPEPSNWSGTIMFVPAPGFTRRISTTIASASGQTEPIPLIILIDTSGRLSVLNGVGLSRNWSLSLDGLIYKL